METRFFVKEKKKVLLKNPIVIFGVSGIGNVGKISLDFLIDSLKAKKIFEIGSYNLPNCAFVKEDNTIELPKFEIYYRNIIKKDLLLITGDIQPTDEKGCYELCEDLVEFLAKLKIKEIICLGGVGLEELPKKIKTYVSGTNKEVIERYMKGNAKKGVDILAGPIVGMVGVLPGLAKERGISGVVLLAETLGHPSHLGITGAQEIIKILDIVLKLKIDIKELDKEVKEIEKELKEKVEKLLPLEETKKVKEKKAVNLPKNPHEISYIG